jgi:plastocyanin
MATVGFTCRWLMLVGLLCSTSVARAVDVAVRVTDASGTVVKDAVVSLQPPAGASVALRSHGASVMDQRGLRFVPFVLAVQAGTLVAFPNSDNVRHHVYSFSPAKRFELRLYAGNHASSVTFDKPGIVTLGCNIHDWMLGYIYVLDTPYFAKTDAAGVAHLAAVPAGTYEVRLWHPRIAGGQPLVVEQKLMVAGASLQRAYHASLHAPDQSNTPPANLEIGLGARGHAHGA